MTERPAHTAPARPHSSPPQAAIYCINTFAAVLPLAVSLGWLYCCHLTPRSAAQQAPPEHCLCPSILLALTRCAKYYLTPYSSSAPGKQSLMAPGASCGACSRCLPLPVLQRQLLVGPQHRARAPHPSKLPRSASRWTACWCLASMHLCTAWQTSLPAHGGGLKQGNCTTHANSTGWYAVPVSLCWLLLQPTAHRRSDTDISLHSVNAANLPACQLPIKSCPGQSADDFSFLILATIQAAALGG